MITAQTGRIRSAPGGATNTLRGLTHSLDLGKEGLMPKRTRLCVVEGCDDRATSRGWCGIHYGRWRKHGDPTVTKGRAIAPIGTRRPTKDGYVSVKVGSDRDKYRWMMEHRVVMEEHIGRALAPGETVHHINGNRSDNRIENLQLWTSPQIYGQRASDLIAYVTLHYRAEVEQFLRTGQLPLLAFGEPAEGGTVHNKGRIDR